MATERHLRVGIVADDLTSAMDGAAPFVRYGAAADALVLVDPNPAASRAQLTAIDVDSRRHDVRSATRLVACATTFLQDSPILFKTVDSTLRGHVGAEVEVAWRASKRLRVVFAPAFPAAGRTTRGGVQLLEGTDVGTTSFGRDRRQPVVSGEIRPLLAPLEANLWAGIGAPLPESGVIVGDATTDSDLDRLVAAVGSGDDVLWVGSAGLAGALARRHGSRSAASLPIAVRARRVAVVIGSIHPVGERQLSALRKRFGTALRTVGTDPDAGTGEIAVLKAPPAPVSVSEVAAARVRSELGAGARRLVESGFDGLVVSGGETARAVISAIEAHAELEILGEPWPGIVLARSRRSEITIATKAGGFGDDQLLAMLCARLLEGSWG